MRNVLRLATALAVCMLVLAACGDSATTTADPVTTSPPPPTTMAPTTTTTVPATTTSVPATTTSVPATTTSAPTTTTTAPTTTSTMAPTTTALDTNTLADGSGCTPGTGDLPDGFWFGFVVATTATTIDFDLACWFTGEAAALAAAEDGEESPPPNDYHIRNANPATRMVPVGPNAEVVWLVNPGDPSTLETVSYDGWLTAREGRDFQPGVWLLIEDGLVSMVEEQYVP